jgi:hypothetical protein
MNGNYIEGYICRLILDTIPNLCRGAEKINEKTARKARAFRISATHSSATVGDRSASFLVAFSLFGLLQVIPHKCVQYTFPECTEPSYVLQSEKEELV